MKVFIADDEQFIIEMLKKIIDWDSVKMTFVGSATDGISAYNKICELKPDIVITDIRMPGYDGLQLINKVKEVIDCHFIVISGYKYFEYAQGAMKFGVKDYLLKPIKAAELMAALKGIKDYVQNDSSSLEGITKAMIENGLKNKVRSSFFTSLVENWSLNTTDIKKTNMEHLTNFSEGEFRFFLIRFDNIIDKEFTESLYRKTISLAVRTLRNSCNDILAKICAEDGIIFLINYDISEENVIKQAFHDIINHSTDYLLKFGKMYITLGVGQKVNQLNQLFLSYKSAISAIRSRVLLGMNCILYYPKEEYPPQLFDELLPEIRKRIITNSVEISNFDNFESTVIQIFADCQATKTMDANIYWDICTEINALFWNAAIHLGIDKNVVVPEAVLATYLNQCTSVEGMKKCLLKHTMALFNRYFDFENLNISAPVIIAKKYISEHYMEKLTLKYIAKLVFLNDVYFSVLFKREMGMGFTDYVNEHRIEASKRVLKQMTFSIAEVAEHVGIPDARYFSKLFKRYVGITPKEFRKKYAGNAPIGNNDDLTKR